MPDIARPFVGALLGLHAQTALHPGAGTALGTVDLPVQRERHTHWPTIAGSALKGVLRDACREIAARDRHGGDRKKANETDELLTALFGPARVEEDSAHAGALSVTDARLLAFPVRSLKGVFAWVSCPAVLERLWRDADLAGLAVPGTVIKVGEDEAALPATDCPCLLDGKHVVLEEFEFTPAGKPDGTVAQWLAANLLPATAAYEPTRRRFARQFLVLSDNDFTHFARHATEVSARIGLDYETKTVKSGALFYQEFLPTETLFYAVLLVSASRARNGPGHAAGALLQRFQEHLPAVLQVGGDETTGKGLCAVTLTAKEGSHGE